MTAQPVPVAVEVSPPQPEPAPRPDVWDRLWARLRSLFVPAVTVSAVLAAKGEDDAAAVVLLLGWGGFLLTGLHPHRCPPTPPAR